jgi:hypothetical protein
MVLMCVVPLTVTILTFTEYKRGFVCSSVKNVSISPLRFMVEQIYNVIFYYHLRPENLILCVTNLGEVVHVNVNTLPGQLILVLVLKICQISEIIRLPSYGLLFLKEVFGCCIIGSGG